MSQEVSLSTALCLPSADIEALIQGQMIAAIPRIFINPGRQFALYPSDIFNNVLPPEQYYHSRLLPTIQNSLNESVSEILIKAWAKCEFCQDLDENVNLETLSKLTIWTIDGLQETLWQRQFIRLAYLRVYLLPQPLEVPANNQEKFVALPKSIRVTDENPVLSDRLFAQRRRQLEKLEPPLHPELEELQGAIALLSASNPVAESLNHHLKKFFGWTTTTQSNTFPNNLAWIYTINDLGTAAIGDNYEKGTAFEQIVHKSLAFLGFGVDPTAKGGAGGMDLYCTTPYPLVGECKSGKSIPDTTVEQLDRIGKRHLGKNDYEIAVKLIIGPGEPTRYLKTSADVSIISIMNPMTLQKLVELQAKYPGSINLIELKSYLKAGQIDLQIDEYIEKVQKRIKLRSHIVQLVKNHLETTGDENAGIDSLHIAYIYSKPPQALKREGMQEILIELSSPLTGYLGRNKGRDEIDRFYFLRDLHI